MKTNVTRALLLRQPLVGFPLEYVQRLDYSRVERVQLEQQPVQLELGGALLELITITDIREDAA